MVTNETGQMKYQKCQFCFAYLRRPGDCFASSVEKSNTGIPFLLPFLFFSYSTCILSCIFFLTVMRLHTETDFSQA